MIGEAHKSRKFDSKTIEALYSPSCRTNKAPQNETDKAGMHDGKINMPDYFRSSTNKAAKERASEVSTNKIHNEFSDVLSGIDCFKGTFILQVKYGSQPYHMPPRRVAYALQESMKEELGDYKGSKQYSH